MKTYGPMFPIVYLSVAGATYYPIYKSL